MFLGAPPLDTKLISINLHMLIDIKMHAFKLIPELLSTVSEYINKSFVLKCAGIYLFCNVIHYACSHMYVHWCVPFTFYGFIASSFLATSPHCIGLRWAMYNSANQIGVFWALIGGYLIVQIEKTWKL